MTQGVASPSENTMIIRFTNQSAISSPVFISLLKPILSKVLRVMTWLVVVEYQNALRTNIAMKNRIATTPLPLGEGERKEYKMKNRITENKTTPATW